MSSKLPLDVCDHSQCWRRLVNVYEVEAGKNYVIHAQPPQRFHN